MLKINSYSKAFISCCLILLQVSTGLGQNLAQSVVRLTIGGVYFCAGTLVRPNFVVTAAHCVQNIPNGQALVAVGGLSVNNGVAVQQTATNVYTPRAYNTVTRDMDVAVIKLAGNLAGTNIQVAALCTQNWQHNTAIQVSAWNIVTQNNLNVPSNLVTYNFNVFGRGMCQQRYPLRFNANHMFCGISQSVCMRDRGGPVNVNGQFCGIISFGPQCPNQNLPLAFTNTGSPDVLQFINRQLQK